jgi:predicted DNA-binding protein (MmcQ/YjbR family)
MDAERVRAIVKKLPYVEETVQWGEHLVFWVGDKAIGGKMFAVVSMDGLGKAVMSFSAGPERYAELVEQEGLIPAPYSAHHYWVALEHWNALDAAELAARLADAHALTLSKLPKRTRNLLALPSAERRKLIVERRKALAAAKAAGPADFKAGLLFKSARKPAKTEPARRSTPQSEGRA